MSDHDLLRNTASMCAIVFFLGCELIATGEIGKGVGQQCAADEECHGAICENGLCTIECGSNADCPAPSECFSARCQLSLRVGFVNAGELSDEGLTAAQEEGRLATAAALPYLRTDRLAIDACSDGQKTLEAFVDRGFDVVIASSQCLTAAVRKEAPEYRRVTFLAYDDSGIQVASNAGSFFGHLEQAYYLAGLSAALKTSTGKLGFVASEPRPAVVRHVNAFTLGAQKYDKTITVQVRWTGSWPSSDLEPSAIKYEDAATALISSGCDVIAHDVHNGRVLKTVEQARNLGTQVFVIASGGAGACASAPTSCLGAVSFNFGAIYSQVLDLIHRGAFDPATPLIASLTDSTSSAVDFVRHPATSNSLLAKKIADARAEMVGAAGIYRPFRGPYGTIGRGKPMGDGETVSESEWRTMCWFVTGVVEAAEPARVPDECKAFADL